MLKLYHYWRSSCSYRVRWSLHHKEIPFKAISVDLLSSEQKSKAFLKLNPSAMVPLLQLATGDLISDSVAILEYLEDRYPHRALLPSGATDRAKVRELCYIITSFIQPLQNLRVQSYLNTHNYPGLAFGTHWMQEGFEILEKKLQKTAGQYCYGGQLSLADICLVPQVYNALRFNVPMDVYPTIKRIYSHCIVLPACKKAIPDSYKP